MGDFQILNDIKGIGIKDLFDAYANINQIKINRGIAESQNYIDKLKAQADLYNAQALATGKTITSAVSNNKLLVVGVVLGLGFVAYKLLK